MKKILALFVALSILTSSFASVIPTEAPKKASEIFVPIGKTGKQISLLDLSQISLKDFEVVSGQKLKFAEKISFKLAQKQIRNSINSDGTLNNKKLEKVLTRPAGETGFHLGGFALGFLLGLIGVLIAYLIKDDYKSNRVKWAWIGLGVIVVLSILLALA
jgi:hypothetical protein